MGFIWVTDPLSRNSHGGVIATLGVVNIPGGFGVSPTYFLPSSLGTPRASPPPFLLLSLHGGFLLDLETFHRLSEVIT